MAPRANWKGVLKVAELSCPVSLFTAASTSERIAFHTLNRQTGHRVQRQFVDSETGEPVEPADQVKGYETGQGDYVVLEPEEIAAVIPESDKVLDVQAFIKCDDIDDTYFDRPYYLAPSNPVAQEAFTLLRESMRSKKVAALARAVLFRRLRSVLIRAHGNGLIATTLNFDYEVRSAEEAFSDIPEMKIEGEMLDLAKHIIRTKKGKFDPKTFDDRYEAAVAELVKAKLEGREIKAPERIAPSKVVDLMAALRESAKASSRSAKPAAKPSRARKGGASKAAATPAPRKKAG
ncbi:Non-homologous end joining protein Ku [Methylocella tundrae]|uniref:Non-homologous end joining protein Ku n=1 Tax=Methylocella tundrae TaxID=227605 RepID=A0A8B6M3M1_METTU|nr:Ku protein [Methylocella tundrae]VTZ27351.1 Non-homologous end joining protein Ku [Methylocella tundrae]VTZ49355.1 Non-homologous end joining protein Ku [Methylocella tundrae]